MSEVFAYALAGVALLAALTALGIVLQDAGPQ